MATRRSAADGSEFLILRTGGKLVPGATVTFIGAAGSADEAMQVIAQMTDTDASRLVIVERRAVVMRRPAMAIDVVDEPAVAP
jgi:hypothetical protein